MTIGAIQLHQYPASPRTVMTTTPWEGEPEKQKHKVCFFAQVRVHRRKIELDGEEDTPTEELWYSRSEYRAMKQDILAFRKIWRQQEREKRNVIEFDEEQHCPRGVELFIDPDQKNLKERRRDLMIHILEDAKESLHGDRILLNEDNTTCSDESASCYASLSETLQRQSEQAVLEALERADQDAKDAVKEYAATCAEIQRAMLQSGNQRKNIKSSSKTSSKRRRKPGRVNTPMPLKSALKLPCSSPSFVARAG